MAAESNRGLAFQRMLGRVEYDLKAKNHLWETMPEFRADRALMEAAEQRERGVATIDVARAGTP